MMKDLFSSKKFIVLLVSLIVYLASRFGLEVKQSELEPLIAMVGAWLVGQGISDAGKGAAKMPKVGVLTIEETVDDKADK